MNLPNEDLNAFRRWLDEDEPPPAAEAQSWLITYLDLMTLLLVLFVALISKATFGPYCPAQPRLQRQAPSPPLPVDPFTPPTPESAMDAMEREIRINYGVLVQMKASKKNVILTLPENMLFKSGEARLEPEGTLFLKRISHSLRQIQGRVQIEGHADSDPISNLKFPSNWELSSARAARRCQGFTRNGC